MAANVKSITDVWTMFDKKADESSKKGAKKPGGGAPVSPLTPVKKFPTPKTADFIIFRRRVGHLWNTIKDGSEDETYMMMTGAESVEDARKWIDCAFTEMLAKYPKLGKAEEIRHCPAGDIDIYNVGRPTFRLEYIIEPVERVMREYGKW